MYNENLKVQYTHETDNRIVQFSSSVMYTTA